MSVCPTVDSGQFKNRLNSTGKPLLIIIAFNGDIDIQSISFSPLVWVMTGAAITGLPGTKNSKKLL